MKSIFILMIVSFALLYCEKFKKSERIQPQEANAEIIKVPIDIDTHKRKNKHSFSSFGHRVNFKHHLRRKQPKR